VGGLNANHARGRFDLQLLTLVLELGKPGRVWAITLRAIAAPAALTKQTSCFLEL